MEFLSNWFYLVGKVRSVSIAVNGEAQCEDHDVWQWGDNAQHHSVPQLEWQHGVHGEDDEEEERHLEKQGSIIVICCATNKSYSTTCCVHSLILSNLLP